MLLKNVIHKAKELLSLDNLRHVFLGGYQRLRATTPNPSSFFSCACTRSTSSKIHHSFRETTMLWDPQTQHQHLHQHLTKPTTPLGVLSREDRNRVPERRRGEDRNRVPERRWGEDRNMVVESRRGEERERSWEERMQTREKVAQKLRELEMLERGNVEHVLDIEETLHYYSRLTCPFYVDIFNKFFLDMYPDSLISHQNDLPIPQNQKKTLSSHTLKPSPY
ncbi:hypothetical protein AMTRI_Chr05g66320 [Amborella trichopoda]